MKRDRQLIERFWALRRSVRFSSTETVLYLALVRLCRDAGWPPALLCPNAALCREAGIDESTLVRARHALIRKGVIGYAGTTAGSHRTCYVLSPLPVPDSEAALPAGERTGPSATGRDFDELQRADYGIPDRADSGRGAACPTPAAKRRPGIGREFAGTDRADNARSDQPVPDSGAADSSEAGMGMNANRDSAGLQRADCGIPDRADSGRGAACPTPAAKRRAGIGRKIAGIDRADNARSDHPVPDSGAADSPQAGMEMNANRDSAGLRIDRPDESAVGNRARNPRAKSTEAGGPDTPAFAPADSGSAPATPPIQPCPCGKPQNPGATARQKGGAKAAQRSIGAGTEAPRAPETGPTGMENSGPRSRRRAVTPPQAGKGAGKEGDYGGDREEERDYPSNGIDHKLRNGWETYRPGNGDVAGEEARAAILPDLLPDILPDLRAGNRHEQRSDTSLETRPDSGADVRPDTRQDTDPETPLDARPDPRADVRPDTQQDTDPETLLDTRPDSWANVRPNTRQDTDPETHLDARPDSGADVRQNTRQDIDPETPLDARPDSRADVRPNTRQDTDPETHLDARPDSQVVVRPNIRQDTDPDTRLDARPDSGADVRAATRHDSPLEGRATRRLKTGTNDAQPATAPAIRSGEDTACCSEQADGRVLASGKGAVRKRVSAPAVPAKGIPSSHPAQTAAAATAECGNPMKETAGSVAQTVATDDPTTPPANPKATRRGTAAAEEAARPTRCPAQTAATATAECGNPMEETDGRAARTVATDDPTTPPANPKATLRGTAAAEEATGCGTVRADDIPVWCAVEEATRSDNGAARSGIRSTQTDIRRVRAGNRAPQPGNPAANAARMTVRSAGAGRESVAQTDREPTQADWKPTQADWEPTQADWEPTQAAPAVGVAEVPTKRRRRVRAELDLSFVGQDFLTPFGEWLAYKRGRGNGYRTQASLEACYERLLRLSDGDPVRAREVVRQSIANNWSGIFELRQNHANHYPIAPAHAGAVPRTAVPPHTDGYTDTL